MRSNPNETEGMTRTKSKAKKKDNNKEQQSPPQKTQGNETNYLVYAELKVVERVEEFSCAAGVVGVGRATAFALQHMLSVHSLTLEHHNRNIYNCSDTF